MRKRKCTYRRGTASTRRSCCASRKAPVAGETVPTPLPVTPVVESEASAQEEQSEKKKNKKPLIIGLCALVLLAAGGAGYALYNHNNNEKAVNQAAVENKANLNAFNKAYDEFLLTQIIKY